MPVVCKFVFVFLSLYLSHYLFFSLSLVRLDSIAVDAELEEKSEG